MGGRNFAWGGAEYGPGPALAFAVPNVGAQIEYYLTGVPPAFLPFLPPLPPGTPSDDQLFVVQAGNNDLIPPGAPTSPDDLVENVLDHVTTLAEAGARHFLVLGSVVVDTVPGLNPPLDAALFFPETPTDAAIEEILTNARIFNRTLHRALFRLERRFKRDYDEPVTITYANLARAGRIVSRRPALFGIDEVATPALNAGPFPPTCFCGGTVADDPDRFFYFDIVHPTATVHEIYGELALAKLKWKLVWARRHH
jgi:phospholipase/lecithinase/hemolysin